eukprot:CFRG7472T1
MQASNMAERGLDTSIVSEFCCPITYDVMTDPVLDPEGNCYERTAIEQWIDVHGTSPITRTPLTKRSLVPNRNLKDLIERMNTHERPSTTVTTVDPLVLEARNIIDDSVAVTTTVMTDNETDGLLADVLVNINTPNPAIDEMASMPLDVCCVVDISYSMSSRADVQAEVGEELPHGLSLLDIVKHAISTVIHSLSPDSRLSIVAFSAEAQLVLPLTAMNEEGREKALKKLKPLKPTSYTNLWAGLDMSLQLMKNRSDQSRFSTIMLLTDGVPTVEPPRGHVETLRHKYLSNPNEPMKCTINTFGFGYSIQSDLLLDLASAGLGSYSFIPDSGFCGTVFVNTLANALSCLAQRVILRIESNHIIDEIPGWAGCAEIISTDHQHAIVIPLGSLRYGQSNNLIFRLKRKQSWESTELKFSVTLTYESRNHSAMTDSREAWIVNTKSNTLNIDCQPEKTVETINAHLFRLQLASILRRRQTLPPRSASTRNSSRGCSKDICEDLQSVKTISARFSKFQALSPFKEIFADINGQISLALSRNDWFNKWGWHYILSLARSYQLQQCSNFKDPGLQGYGGGIIFTHFQDIADDNFNRLPPPVPSIKLRLSNGSTGQTGPISMRVYNNNNAPCFHGNALVHMSDGTYKKVKDIVKGDRLLAPTRANVPSRTDAHDEIVCVVRTVLDEEKKSLMVTLPTGLCLTPWHPIRQDGVWKFPADIEPPAFLHVDAVYSFVIARTQRSIIINDTECAVLGHGLTENDVVAHSYFGTNAVVNDLMLMNGWEKGLITVTGVIRNPHNGYVCGLQS